MIEIKKGDLFKGAPATALLVHACNARGVWGSGVAVGFRNGFPQSYEDYKKWCIENTTLGTTLITDRVGCMVTSNGYGKHTDPPKKILASTELALQSLLDQVGDFKEIHSPKFNSGLFRVPWGETEKLIVKALENKPDLKWVVWEL